MLNLRRLVVLRFLTEDMEAQDLLCAPDDGMYMTGCDLRGNTEELVRCPSLPLRGRQGSGGGPS